MRPRLVPCAVPCRTGRRFQLLVARRGLHCSEIKDCIIQPGEALLIWLCAQHPHSHCTAACHSPEGTKSRKASNALSLSFLHCLVELAAGSGGVCPASSNQVEKTLPFGSVLLSPVRTAPHPCFHCAIRLKEQGKECGQSCVSGPCFLAVQKRLLVGVGGGTAVIKPGDEAHMACCSLHWRPLSSLHHSAASTASILEEQGKAHD